MNTNRPVLLNIDDNEVGRYTKSKVLQHAGFEVIEGKSGAEALALAKERRPDLVLLDVKLPDISGLEVCRILKHEYPEMFVLQISASRVTEGDRVRGLEGGADGYLTQPLAPDELVANVRALLRIRNAEHALRASEAQLQGVLASATDYAIIRLDLQGVIIGWNVGAQSIFGWSAEEALGQHVRIVFNDEDRRLGVPENELQTARDTGRADDRRWLVRKDGTPFYANGVTTILSRPAEPGFVKILRDQTDQFEAERALQDLNATLESRVSERTRELEESNERLRLEMEERLRTQEQLRQSQKMDALGQLTGGIAHDFNNMLAVVMAGLGLIETQVGRGVKDISKYTQGVLESAKRASDLTQRLLAFSRQQPLSPEALNVNALVTKLTSLLGRTLGENIKIVTNLEPGLGTVKADPSQLESALLNLAVNARDAMASGGLLTFTTRNIEIDDGKSLSLRITPGAYVLIDVQDTGSGMPPEVIERAFDPFFTTKGVGKGTGLGLSQVFGFVRQSAGHVKISSEVGRGTSIQIFLPQVVEHELSEASEQKGVVATGSAAETILVVEDEDRLRVMTVEALRELGYAVIHAASGPEGLRLIEGGARPSLLFTDMMMPGMTGSELAAEAKKQIPSLKVLYTTGYMRPSAQIDQKVAGEMRILQKPFNLDELALKVRQVLDEA